MSLTSGSGATSDTKSLAILRYDKSLSRSAAISQRPPH